jgi:hypothetical protein
MLSGAVLPLLGSIAGLRIREVEEETEVGLHDSLVPIHICTSNLSRRIRHIRKDSHPLSWTSMKFIWSLRLRSFNILLYELFPFASVTLVELRMHEHGSIHTLAVLSRM